MGEITMSERRGTAPTAPPNGAPPRSGGRWSGWSWRPRCLVGWLGCAALVLAVPAGAQDNLLDQMDQQVKAIVRRVTPSVVSVRVGPRSVGKAGSRPLRRGRGAPPLVAVEDGRAIALYPAASVSSCGATTRVKRGARVLLGEDSAVKGNLLDLVRPARVGTGFVADRGGIILTTADVVGNSQQVQVNLSDGRELDGKVLGSDGGTGVAVVRVEGADLPALHLAEEARPEPGQWTIIVGNQLDTANSVWVGTVARTDAALSGPLQGRLLQIHAPVGAGASGAPVLDARGDVIGVVVASASPWFSMGAADTGALDQAVVALRDKMATADAKSQREVAEKAKRVGREAAERARALREKAQGLSRGTAERARALSEKARQLSAAAAERTRALHRKYESDLRRDPDDPRRREAEKRLETDQERLERELESQMERELKPLEEELERQMETELKPLQEELERLNEHLPAVEGVREITVDVAPEIARVVAEAQTCVRTAVVSALAAISEPAKPAAPVTPGAAPAPPALAPIATPAPAPAPAAAPVVRFWAGRSPGDGASTYAIPAARARWAMAQIRENGRVAHPFLGLQLADLKPEDRDRLKAPEEARVRVLAVLPDSPAQEAGLQKDDLVLEFQGKPVAAAADLIDHMAQQRVGDRVSLVIWRGGERRTLQATLREQPRRAFPQGAFVFPNPVPGVPRTPFPPGRAPVAPQFIVPDGRLWRGTGPLTMRLFAPGRAVVRATGNGRSARVTLDAQDAELETVLRELSRATHLDVTAEGDAARRRITLRVDDVPVEDLVDSLDRLYHLRSERRGDRYTFHSH